MPELPEVETVVRGLNATVCGYTIIKVAHVSPHLRVREPKLRRLKGETFTQFDRRGKYIIAGLKSKQKLLIHLRMTGKLLIQEKFAQRSRHDHLELILKQSGSKLVFRDVRKFGIIKFLNNSGNGGFDKLGIEATEITPTILFRIMQASNRPIKALLLDQNKIAGLGNIYVDESLFRSKIHPLFPARQISRLQAGKLAAAIKLILAKAIDKMGTTFDTFSGIYGDSGRFTDYLKVYNNNGNECKRCGSEIVKIKAAGRGTHYCPTCQTV